ncbi:MAG: Exodeoxyribonuclease 7 small subunit [Acidimicrobiales bacterium]|nr:Exodeoxyribonuclease 7 small subunit [Acidimicrobiales bacterium]
MADDFGALTYEQLVERLERLTDQMAAGDIGIEEAAALYEQAGRLHAAATERLAAIEKRIQALEPEAPA